MLRVYIFTITLITIIHLIVGTRKYDIETEALKLYGEDLATVLKRFRRTPEYLHILNDKLHDIILHQQDTSLQILHYYINKIKERVASDLGVSLPGPADTTPALPSYFKRFRSRRQGDDPAPVPPTPEPDDHEQDAELERQAVYRLDHYEMLNSPLTLAERNGFRDLGFEFAGHVIHAIIKNSGVENPEEDVPVQSTKGILSGDQEETTTTTEHVQVHEVTTTPHTEESETSATEVTTNSNSTPDRLRNKGRGRFRG